MKTSIQSIFYLIFLLLSSICLQGYSYKVPQRSARSSSAFFTLPEKKAKPKKPAQEGKKRLHGQLLKPSQRADVERKTFSQMSFEELKEAKRRKLAENKKDIVMKYLERMLKICDDLNEIADMMIELADLLLDDNQCTKAGTLYKEFTSLYPGHKKVEYALYKAIYCCFKEISDPDRDQSKTQETIELVDKFLSRADIFKDYENEVKKIKQECYAILAKSEFGICEFYLKKELYNAVECRLKTVRNTFLSEAPEIETQLVALETELLAKQEPTEKISTNNADLKDILSESVTQNIPSLIKQV